MASSYNTIGLELMATGENAGTWGSKTNSNLNLVEQAIAGYEAVTITDSTTTTLVMSNAALSNARNMIIKIATITLTGATTVTIPNGIEKFYIFDLTAITGVTNLTIKTASGTGFTAGEAKIVAAYSDGTNLNEIALDTLGGTIGSAQIANNAILSAAISANQVTTAKIADNAITTAKISALQVTGAKIAQSTITAAKLATDSVGPDQLISTGVTAGAYTTANITVDADGRITTASSGAGGDGGYIYTYGAIYGAGPEAWSASTTYTANPTATKILVYAIGGGGGGAGNQTDYGVQPGGNGGFGYYTAPISAPYSQPFTVGAGGTGGGQGNPGPSGSSTYFGPGPTPLLLVTGGQGGNHQSATPGGNPANAGAMPTGTKDLSNRDYNIYAAFGNNMTRLLPAATADLPGRGGAGNAYPNAGRAGGGGMVAIYELI
jgi:hypothetical protein